MLERALARHDLAWLVPAACASARLAADACVAPATAHTLLVDWVAAGHPLIVTRQPMPSGGNEVIALGLALPPQRGKLRLGFLVDRSAITRLAAPPTLAEVIDSLPAAWRPKAEALLASPAVGAAQPRVYGSAAMQMHSGEPCLSAASDLDLYLAPGSWPAVQAVLAALVAIEAALPGPRVDGEIAAADGGAVAWRELAGAPARVLVKHLHGVGLESLADFQAGFAAAERLVA